MKLSNSMAYNSPEDMIFGSAKYPVITKHGLELGGRYVIPEVVPHPRPGSEKSIDSLLREFERANGDALDRCVKVGHPYLMIENEHISQMTHNPDWGAKIAQQTAYQINEYKEKYGLIAANRSTIADIRKPEMINMRDSERTSKVIQSFIECSQFADIVSIESMGGKEITDYALIRNDITGMLFGQAVLGSRDMEWLWTQVIDIAKRNNCIAGGDTDCSQANVAMFMAGGFISKDIPHTLAALTRAISASRTLVAYECGATGPGKDCGYENPIIKAIAGIPIATEGKTSACAHSDLCGNVMAAVCDLWSNEAVQYHEMFGGSTPAVFAEILGYDVALMNTAIDMGYQKELQSCFINSDRYRDPQSFILCPDNAWLIGKTIVENNDSFYSRARAAAFKCGELIFGASELRLTDYEKDSLQEYMKEIESLPDKEDDFIDMCLAKYSTAAEFRPASYGL